MESSPLNMQRSFLGNVVVLPLIVRRNLPSIMLYVFQAFRFLHNMQCVIDILYCCQKKCKDQCTSKHSLTEGKILKEHAAYRLQSAWCSLEYEATLLQGNCNLWRTCNTSFNEVRLHAHVYSMAFVLTKGFPFFQKNCHEDKMIPEKTQCLQKDNTWPNTIHS